MGGQAEHPMHPVPGHTYGEDELPVLSPDEQEDEDTCRLCGGEGEIEDVSFDAFVGNYSVSVYQCPHVRLEMWEKLANSQE